MRCAEGGQSPFSETSDEHGGCPLAAAIVLGLFVLAAGDPAAQSAVLVHRQQYSMGTLFDVMVYHASRAEAGAAVEEALAEVVRLDGVLSDFESDSELSRLVRDARRGSTTVSPDLYAVLEESRKFSRLSAGKFDVTIRPLLRVWREARDEQRRPTEAALAEARRCVGFEHVELEPPDRVRFRSDCVEIDFGGIGKGYAVDRGMKILAGAGMRNALINAGSSSIASTGHPPSKTGWPVQLGPDGPAGRTLLLQNASVSTSQQTGNIIDPATGAAHNPGMTVSVIAPTATASDALSTTLLVAGIEESRKILAPIPDVSAFWISPGGKVIASHGESRVRFADAR